MLCLSVCSRTLKRFPKQKVKSLKSSVCVIRCKMQAAILGDENIAEIEGIHYESNSLTWLHKCAPAFPIDGSKVTIFHEPAKFYAALLEKCRNSKKRITLASLYIGTGEMEKELINSIKKSIESNCGNIKVTILLDYMRGSRGKVNSRNMLKTLLKGEVGNHCNVFLYHTPRLRGLLKALIPDRFNELIGLQHMKLYVIDDTLIISGANLSNDYFSNRQDRYFMFEDCKELCDFYCDLVNRVSEFSFQLNSDGTDYWNENSFHPVESSNDVFVSEASDKVRSLFLKEINKRSDLHKQDLKEDTWVFPLVQMGQLNIRHDSQITLQLLKTAQAGSVLRLATGYFNLTTNYKEAIIDSCRAECHLLTAHPEANGFFRAKGVAGGIPAAYSKIENSFFELCKKFKQDQRIKLWEFMKPGWTYHAKGLWYSMPGQQKPSLTLIGSPNFGYRSVERDLETQVALLTTNKNLQDSLQKEYEHLFNSAEVVTSSTFQQKERIPPAWVRVAVLLFRYYF
ncbi:hypothetical protein QAD02_009103 [Eretmocerus hayati]|uniref:Uncharacterized protein n=1 Tax=Eretmocerus hayati TaxID=131215 RepID=A0ACC2NCT1_9HYME|nr:hypothetical protein QAD02_009103 [Eretmocerus hayati]